MPIANSGTTKNFFSAFGTPCPYTDSTNMRGLRICGSGDALSELSEYSENSETSEEWRGLFTVFPCLPSLTQETRKQQETQETNIGNLFGCSVAGNTRTPRTEGNSGQGQAGCCTCFTCFTVAGAQQMQQHETDGSPGGKALRRRRIYTYIIQGTSRAARPLSWSVVCQYWLFEAAVALESRCGLCLGNLLFLRLAEDAVCYRRSAEERAECADDDAEYHCECE